MTRKISLPIRGSVLVCLALTIVTAAAPSAGAAQLQPLIAPPAVCPDQSDAGAPSVAQVRAMQCLVEQARLGRGLAGLGEETGLNRAAAQKSDDILRCDEFSHEACGREFTYWMQRFGYFDAGCSGAAENIAWGVGSLASPRSIFRAWMRSPGHRQNILGPYALLGIGLRVGALEGHSRAHVWTQEFAGHGC